MFHDISVMRLTLLVKENGDYKVKTIYIPQVIGSIENTFHGDQTLNTLLLVIFSTNNSTIWIVFYNQNQH